MSQGKSFSEDSDREQDAEKRSRREDDLTARRAEPLGGQNIKHNAGSVAQSPDGKSLGGHCKTGRPRRQQYSNAQIRRPRDQPFP